MFSLQRQNFWLVRIESICRQQNSVFDRVENNVGKGENADYQHFLLFPQSFKKTFYLGLLKVGIV